MKINFPPYTGLRCLMMPFIQGDPQSVPNQYSAYSEIISCAFIDKGEIGYLTIDESPAKCGKPHRGKRAKTNRAIHTEAGRRQDSFAWGWGTSHAVTLDRDVEILLANNLDYSCAIWDSTHEETSFDGDIGHVSHLYPYADATFMRSGEVHRIGILTPHESLPVKVDFNRQFLRIVSSGVHGREPYFTRNPLLESKS